MDAGDSSNSSDPGEVPRNGYGCELIFQRAGRGFARKRIQELAERIAAAVAGGRQFTCLLTDDRELRRLNREFLKKDYATDVLSFPSLDGEEPLGELAISADRAREQADEQGHAAEDEIGILMLHGVLHLLGLDHAKDRGRMARAERRWREHLGLPAGLIERTEK